MCCSSCMSFNSVQSFVIENCNGPTIENGLNKVCLHPLSRTFTFYAITTTLPHPELLVKESYVKELKMKYKPRAESIQHSISSRAAQRNNHYTTSELSNVRPIFLLILISIEPFRSPRALLTNALVQWFLSSGKFPNFQFPTSGNFW